MMFRHRKNVACSLFSFIWFLVLISGLKATSYVLRVFVQKQNEYGKVGEGKTKHLFIVIFNDIKMQCYNTCFGNRILDVIVTRNFWPK